MNIFVFFNLTGKAFRLSFLNLMLPWVFHLYLWLCWGISLLILVDWVFYLERVLDLSNAFFIIIIITCLRNFLKILKQHPMVIFPPFHIQNMQERERKESMFYFPLWLPFLKSLMEIMASIWGSFSRKTIWEFPEFCHRVNHGSLQPCIISSSVQNTMILQVSYLANRI